MIYLYEHPRTKKIIEVSQGAHDEHTFIDDKGVKWNRVFTVPNVQVDSTTINIDPYDAQKFVEVTGRKKGSVGDLLKFSQELSEKRGGADKDPIIEKRNRDYKKKFGVEHASVLKQKSKKRLKKLGINVTH